MEVGFEVDLTQDDRYLGRFITSNIGPQGAFVETGPVGLTREDFLTITFLGEKDRHPRRCLQGFVVHRDGEGIGVRYATSDPVFWNLARETPTAARI
jgi:hypothetical protein